MIQTIAGRDVMIIRFNAIIFGWVVNIYCGVELLFDDDEWADVSVQNPNDWGEWCDRGLRVW